MKKEVTVALLLSFLILSERIIAQPTPSVVADAVANNGPVYYGHERNVARTSDGNILMVAWQDKASGGQVVYSIYDNDFQTWSPAQPISSAGDEADNIGLVADTLGRIHAVWHQRDNLRDKNQVYYSRYESGSFSVPVKVSKNQNQNSEAATVEIDSEGRIFVVWNTESEPDGDEWLLCNISSDDGVSWSAPDTLSSPDGLINGTSITNGRVALYPGSSGRMMATWHEDGSGREREIYVNQYDGTHWQGEVISSDTTAAVDRHWYPNCAVDSRDNIYVIYSSDLSGDDNPRYLLFVKKAWDAPEWPAERDTVHMSPSRDYLQPTITVDKNNLLYVAFRRDVDEDTLYALDEIAYEASNDGGHTWTSPVTISRPNHDAGYPTMVARVFGDGVDIVWREPTSENVNDEDITTILQIYMNLLEVIDRAPEIMNIPNQSINEGESFNSFDLDNHLIEFDGDAISWTYRGNNELVVSIDEDNVVTVTTPVANWVGSETITFTATDQTTGGLSDSASVIFTSLVVGVETEDRIPASYRLLNNYPNPFNPTTNIEFHLKAAGVVQLKVYNLLGEEVTTLAYKEMNAGIHQVQFNASNLPSGIFFYRILVNEFSSSKKMLLLK